MERELGNRAHDGAAGKRGERHLPVHIGRVQGRPRVHRRIHLPQVGDKQTNKQTNK